MDMLLNAPNWEGFKTGLTEFFKNGLGGTGAEGIGIALMVIGFVGAIACFAISKMNPRAQVPSWGWLLVVGVAGAFLTGGMAKPIELFEAARDTLYGWFGI